jgi:hypothetical protein
LPLVIDALEKHREVEWRPNGIGKNLNHI